MAGHILESTRLRATISGPVQLTGKINKEETVKAAMGIPTFVGGTSYIAGNGIVISSGVILLDDLILDCGTSTTVI